MAIDRFDKGAVANSWKIGEIPPPYKNRNPLGTKWEYVTITLWIQADKDKYLNEYGNEGWELIWLEHGEQSIGHPFTNYYFKREKIEDDGNEV